MANAKSTGNSARKSASKAAQTASAPPMQLQLRMIAVELRCALSAITVSVRTLSEQNADIDADVALVLQRGAGAPIHVGLERLEALLTQLEGAGGAGAEPEQECVH
jgi:hypothetical protein